MVTACSGVWGGEKGSDRAGDRREDMARRRQQQRRIFGSYGGEGEIIKIGVQGKEGV